MNTTDKETDWIYLKLYFGKAVDRMDGAIVDLGKLADQQDAFKHWFYLRYFDDTGIHLRVRALPAAGVDPEHARNCLDGICATVLSRLHEHPATTHAPMVSPPGFEDDSIQDQMTAGHVHAEYDRYEPEFDKYGGADGVRIAEALFAESSRIACAVLEDESRGLYSRKSLGPVLMNAAFQAFRPVEDEVFWRHYCRFWLGGDSPAAEDWRMKFFAKGRELRDQAVEVCPSMDELPEAARPHCETWSRALEQAAEHYRKSDIDAGLDVLAFNFSHLTMNRLGLTALEEAYMAALLEQRSEQVENRDEAAA